MPGLCHPRSESHSTLRAWSENFVPNFREEFGFGVGVRLIFETNGLKVVYFQGVETKHFQHRFNLMCSTCTA